MKRFLLTAAFVLLGFIAAAGQRVEDPLLEKFAGNWVMTGTIAGGPVVHDVEAEWVLEHQYFRFHELAREKDTEGRPAYESIVFIGWDKPNLRYVCLWLDSTGGSGLSNGVLGYAKPGTDELRFVFDMGKDGIIHTTFAYNRKHDTWQWTIDTENDGKRKQFALVDLKRK